MSFSSFVTGVVTCSVVSIAVSFNINISFNSPKLIVISSVLPRGVITIFLPALSTDLTTIVSPVIANIFESSKVISFAISCVPSTRAIGSIFTFPALISSAFCFANSDITCKSSNATASSVTLIFKSPSTCCNSSIVFTLARSALKLSIEYLLASSITSSFLEAGSCVGELTSSLDSGFSGIVSAGSFTLFSKAASSSVYSDSDKVFTTIPPVLTSLIVYIAVPSGYNSISAL